MFETIRRVTRFVLWLDERECLHKQCYTYNPGGRFSCWGVGWVNNQDHDPDHLFLLFLPTSELYHEAIKLAEKLREQQREAEELRKLVKELEALERQLRALQEHCERAKREAKEREEGEREESGVAQVPETKA